MDKVGLKQVVRFVYFQYEIVDKFEIRECAFKSYTSEIAVFYNCLEVFTFIVPLIMIIHNYARVSYTLIKSLKQNAQLMEGNQQEWDR